METGEVLMKKYIVEIVICFLQLFMFYIVPLFAGPADGMGLVIFILLATLILSIFIACISKNRIKYLYPAATAVAFLPSVFLYYNETAFIHAIWYFVVSTAGMLVGLILYKILHWK